MQPPIDASVFLFLSLFSLAVEGAPHLLRTRHPSSRASEKPIPPRPPSPARSSRRTRPRDSPKRRPRPGGSSCRRPTACASTTTGPRGRSSRSTGRPAVSTSRRTGSSSCRTLTPEERERLPLVFLESTEALLARYDGARRARRTPASSSSRSSPRVRRRSEVAHASRRLRQAT